MKWTEHQIEDWLVPIKRTIVDGDGKSIELEQATLFWEYFDYLVNGNHFTEAELIELGWETVKEFGFPFSLGIQDAVAHLYQAHSAKD